MPGRALFDKLHNFKTIAPAKHTYVILLGWGCCNSNSENWTDVYFKCERTHWLCIDNNGLFCIPAGIIRIIIPSGMPMIR